jgi:hypothetical protein
MGIFLIFFAPKSRLSGTLNIPEFIKSPLGDLGAIDGEECITNNEV